MSRPKQPIKLTVEVDNDLYLSVSSKLHHGQLTQIIRKVMEQVNQKYQNDCSGEVYNWLYANEPIVLGGDQSNE